MCAAAAAGARLSRCGPLAPSCSGRSSPSRSLLSPCLPCAPCLSLPVSLALIFFPAAAASAPRPAEPAGRLLVHSFRSPELSAGSRISEPPRPLPPARTPGSPVAGGRLCRRGSPARSLALAGAGAERRVLGGGCSRAAASSSLRRPGLRAAPRRAQSAASAPPPRPVLWAPRETASGRRRPASPGRAGAPPNPRRGSDLARAR